jgi:hypothetical protein
LKTAAEGLQPLHENLIRCTKDLDNCIISFPG